MVKIREFYILCLLGLIIFCAGCQARVSVTSEQSKQNTTKSRITITKEKEVGASNLYIITDTKNDQEYIAIVNYQGSSICPIIKKEANEGW
jgi:hypothetical protein